MESNNLDNIVEVINDSGDISNSPSRVENAVEEINKPAEELKKEPSLFCLPSLVTPVSEIKLFILPKINFLTTHTNFFLTYSEQVFYLFSKLTELMSKKISNTLNQNKNFMRFFKEITSAYQNFSNELNKAKSELTDDKSKNLIFNENINTVVEQAQDTISNNFKSFSQVLHSNIVTKGPFVKIAGFLKRFENSHKEIKNSLEKLSEKKSKLQKVFSTKYSPLFEQFKSKFNDNTFLENHIFNKNDFFVIELDLITHYNTISETANEFFENFKKQIAEFKKLISDYINLIKDTMHIYLSENKKVFPGLLDLNLETITKHYESLGNDSIEANLSPKNILRDELNIKQFNDMLSDYYNQIKKYNTIVKNDVLLKEETYIVTSYKSLNDFVDTFKKLLPEKIQQNKSFLVEKTYDVKRDPGVFSSWKNSIMVITKQNNMLIFDDEIKHKNFVDLVNLKKIKFNCKSEKKYPYRFEVVETRRGSLFDSNTNFLIDSISKDKYDELLNLIGENQNNI